MEWTTRAEVCSRLLELELAGVAPERGRMDRLGFLELAADASHLLQFRVLFENARLASVVRGMACVVLHRWGVTVDRTALLDTWTSELGTEHLLARLLALATTPSELEDARRLIGRLEPSRLEWLLSTELLPSTLVDSVLERLARLELMLTHLDSPVAGHWLMTQLGNATEPELTEALRRCPPEHVSRLVELAPRLHPFAVKLLVLPLQALTDALGSAPLEARVASALRRLAASVRSRGLLSPPAEADGALRVVPHLRALLWKTLCDVQLEPSVRLRVLWSLFRSDPEAAFRWARVAARFLENVECIDALVSWSSSTHLDLSLMRSAVVRRSSTWACWTALHLLEPAQTAGNEWSEVLRARCDDPQARIAIQARAHLGDAMSLAELEWVVCGDGPVLDRAEALRGLAPTQSVKWLSGFLVPNQPPLLRRLAAWALALRRDPATWTVLLQNECFLELGFACGIASPDDSSFASCGSLPLPDDDYQIGY